MFKTLEHFGVVTADSLSLMRPNGPERVTFIASESVSLCHTVSSSRGVGLCSPAGFINPTLIRQKPEGKQLRAQQQEDELIPQSQQVSSGFCRLKPLNTKEQTPRALNQQHTEQTWTGDVYHKGQPIDQRQTPYSTHSGTVWLHSTFSWVKYDKTDKLNRVWSHDQNLQKSRQSNLITLSAIFLSDKSDKIKGLYTSQFYKTHIFHHI